MNLVLELTVKIFVVMAVGFAAKKAGIIDTVCQKKLSALLVNLLLPVSMIASSQQIFAMENLKGVGEIAGISFLYYVLAFVIGLSIGKAVKMDRQKTAVFTVLIAFANTGFIGMPVLGEVIGAAGTLYGAVFNSVFDILYFSYGIYLISGSGKEGISIKKLLCNPMAGIAVGTVILYVLPWRFPQVVTDSLNLLGNCMMPVSMLVIGAEIAEMNVKEILFDKASYGVSLFRMFLFPAAVFCMMKMLKIQYETAVTAVILSAMPSGSLNVIMAQKYNNHAQFAARAVMQNTIIMTVTLPAVVYLCGFLQ